MIIPLDQLSDDVLEGIVEAFILREGTDYGDSEVSFDDKKKQLLAQLNSGEVVVVYSELHETANIMPANAFNGKAQEY